VVSSDHLGTTQKTMLVGHKDPSNFSRTFIQEISWIVRGKFWLLIRPENIVFLLDRYKRGGIAKKGFACTWLPHH